MKIKSTSDRERVNSYLMRHQCCTYTSHFPFIIYVVCYTVRQGANEKDETIKIERDNAQKVTDIGLPINMK